MTRATQIIASLIVLVGSAVAFLGLPNTGGTVVTLPCDPPLSLLKAWDAYRVRDRGAVRYVFDGRTVATRADLKSYQPPAGEPFVKCVVENQVVIYVPPGVSDEDVAKLEQRVRECDTAYYPGRERPLTVYVNRAN